MENPARALLYVVAGTVGLCLCGYRFWAPKDSGEFPSLYRLMPLIVSAQIGCAGLRFIDPYLPVQFARRASFMLWYLRGLSSGIAAGLLLAVLASGEPWRALNKSFAVRLRSQSGSGMKE